MSDAGKTHFVLSKDEKTSTYLQVERNDHKQGRDARVVVVLEYLGQSSKL